MAEEWIGKPAGNKAWWKDHPTVIKGSTFSIFKWTYNNGQLNFSKQTTVSNTPTSSFPLRDLLKWNAKLGKGYLWGKTEVDNRKKTSWNRGLCQVRLGLHVCFWASDGLQAPCNQRLKNHCEYTVWGEGGENTKNAYTTR